jgi:hypothetical protein
LKHVPASPELLELCAEDDPVPLLDPVPDELPLSVTMRASPVPLPASGPPVASPTVASGVLLLLPIEEPVPLPPPPSPVGSMMLLEPPPVPVPTPVPVPVPVPGRMVSPESTFELFVLEHADRAAAPRSDRETRTPATGRAFMAPLVARGLTPRVSPNVATS